MALQQRNDEQLQREESGEQRRGAVQAPRSGEPQPGDRERVQSAFFTATFSVMGHLAKADGRISPQEIALAEAKAAFEKGEILERGVLDIDEQAYLDTLSTNASQSFHLAVHLGSLEVEHAQLR